MLSHKFLIVSIPPVSKPCSGITLGLLLQIAPNFLMITPKLVAKCGFGIFRTTSSILTTSRLLLIRQLHFVNCNQEVKKERRKVVIEAQILVLNP